jgi:glucan phosphoethanolaminetransferase (alkaline phosphatase superfamily)
MAIIEEIKNIKGNKSDWKKFGITMGIILSIIGFYLLWKKNNNYNYILFLAAAFFITGLILPSILRPVYKVWMALAVVMNFIMTRVIMAVIFYLVVTPIGLIACLTGKEFLDMKIDKSAKSYWILREKTKKLKSDYERQF